MVPPVLSDLHREVPDPAGTFFFGGDSFNVRLWVYNPMKHFEFVDTFGVYMLM